MPTPCHVSHTGVVPGAHDDVFARTLAEPLDRLFRRRYLAIPPIAEVRDQAGAWTTPGQTRTIVLADGGTMRETLTVVEAPHRFAYAIDHVTGPMSPLVSTVAGTWSFAPEGSDRTRVTWEWVISPRRYAAPLMPAFAAMWRGMARRAFEDLADVVSARS
jgi:hypothetical protein